MVVFLLAFLETPPLTGYPPKRSPAQVPIARQELCPMEGAIQDADHGTPGNRKMGCLECPWPKNEGE